MRWPDFFANRMPSPVEPVDGYESPPVAWGVQMNVNAASFTLFSQTLNDVRRFIRNRKYTISAFYFCRKPPLLKQFYRLKICQCIETAIHKFGIGIDGRKELFCLTGVREIAASFSGNIYFFP